MGRKWRGRRLGEEVSRSYREAAEGTRLTWLLEWAAAEKQREVLCEEVRHVVLQGQVLWRNVDVLGRLDGPDGPVRGLSARPCSLNDNESGVRRSKDPQPILLNRQAYTSYT